MVILGWYLVMKLLPRRRLVLPPGPNPLPFIGNMLDLASKEPWLRVSRWAQKFGMCGLTTWHKACLSDRYFCVCNAGDICYLHILGQHIVFINRVEIASELLEKRGAIYSGKPRLIMVGEMYVHQFSTCDPPSNSRFMVGADAQIWWVLVFLTSAVINSHAHRYH